MKIYVITRFELENSSEHIVKVYSEKNKDTAKEVVDRLNRNLSEDDTVEYRLTSYITDQEDCYD